LSYGLSDIVALATSYLQYRSFSGIIFDILSHGSRLQDTELQTENCLPRPRGLPEATCGQSDQEVLKGVREQTSSNDAGRPSRAIRARAPTDGTVLSHQPVAPGTIDRETIENLRGYILFLEEMDAKYRPEESLTAHREQRVHRAIDAAFPEEVQSPSEGN